MRGPPKIRELQVGLHQRRAQLVRAREILVENSLVDREQDPDRVVGRFQSDAPDPALGVLVHAQITVQEVTNSIVVRTSRSET